MNTHGETLDNVLADAHGRGCDRMYYDWRAWPQVWGDTSLGFGGIAGQAMTEAQTIIVADRLTDDYYVYFGGRWAYTVHHPRERFIDAVKQQQMPGRHQVSRTMAMVGDLPLGDGVIY